VTIAVQTLDGDVHMVAEDVTLQELAERQGWVLVCEGHSQAALRIEHLSSGMDLSTGVAVSLSTDR
jgi:hypothetical protein